MITVTDLSLNYSGTPLFSHVDLQFLRGNCYGIIGANGAGKSTFLKILSGELDSTSGEVNILPNIRKMLAHGLANIDFLKLRPHLCSHGAGIVVGPVRGPKAWHGDAVYIGPR